MTDERQDRGVQKGIEFAILTDEISKAWSGMSTRQYKNLKGLKKENLRDNMNTTEIVLNMLAEVSTTEISKPQQSQSFEENRTVAKQGGKIASDARINLEKATGKSVITNENAAQLNLVVTDVIESIADDEKNKN